MSGGISATTIMAAGSMALTAASAGMSIIGAANQSAAQRASGEAAYQNALQRNSVAQVQARQMEVNAGQEQAASQRQAIEQRRKGMVMASRLRAVMGASGAGIDENLLASVQGEGDYNAATALYGGDEKARGLRNQAALTRWSGESGVGMGAFDRSAQDSAADATLIGGIARTGLSFAAKYGGDLPGASSSTGAGDFHVGAGPIGGYTMDYLRASDPAYQSGGPLA